MISETSSPLNPMPPAVERWATDSPRDGHRDDRESIQIHGHSAKASDAIFQKWQYLKKALPFNIERRFLRMRRGGRIILLEHRLGSSQLSGPNLANAMMTLEALEDELSCPFEEDIAFMRSNRGDIMILGAGGKMGPSLARRARRAADGVGGSRRIFAVSRFASDTSKRQLAAWGVEPISCDLLDRSQIARLPDCANVLFLAGRKFGSTENLPLTWATNAILPALVMERFRGSRMVALSSGNIYPLVARSANEQTPPLPFGEYAQSVLARERIFEYFSARDATPVAIIRLNYAIDLRYGVLLDIGERVWQRRPVSLVMGSVNVIWQGDANSACLRALALAAAPPLALNVTGPEVLQVRSIAERFGEIFDMEPLFEGSEAPTALLSDSSLSCRLLGLPRTNPERMIKMTAEWIRARMPTLNKPTHFEVRNGAF